MVTFSLLLQLENDNQLVNSKVIIKFNIAIGLVKIGKENKSQEN